MKTSHYLFASLLLAIIASFSHAQSSSNDIVAVMQKQWAIANYKLVDKEQDKAFLALIADSDDYVNQHKESAEVYIWRGIINSTYAGVNGGLGALTYAKAAKKDFETALEMDPTALQGSAYTSLGTLYNGVPGWPISFGDDDKAGELLEKALTTNPAGIDSNYFYAKYLIGEKEYTKARQYLQTALAAPARDGRELADEGRIGEINAALEKIAKKLK